MEVDTGPNWGYGLGIMLFCLFVLIFWAVLFGGIK